MIETLSLARVEPIARSRGPEPRAPPAPRRRFQWRSLLRPAPEEACPTC